MNLRGPTARNLGATAVFLCVSCAFAAPAVIGFVAPDEEPRYANLCWACDKV